MVTSSRNTWKSMPGMVVSEGGRWRSLEVAVATDQGVESSKASGVR